MYERILTAIDWTASTEAVLGQTRRLASLTGATVHVLHVQAMNLSPAHSTLGYLASQAQTTEPATRDASSAPRRMLDDAVAALSAAGVHTTGLLLACTAENTAQAVLDQALDLDVDLIVLGSRRHGWPFAVFRSSVTDEVSRHARCPVLIVP
jgi:nucleotide-binding universal stress UspA family protein